MSEPRWVKVARKHIGKSEVAGKASNEWILSLWQTIPWIWSTVARKDDSVLPWCGAFCRHVFVESGITPPKNWWSAAAWAKWGKVLHRPIVGCVGVMKRKGGAHVTIVVGRDNAHNILCIGGNQDDAVKISAYPLSRFSDWVWPEGEDMDLRPLPILSAALAVSEA